MLGLDFAANPTAAVARHAAGYGPAAISETTLERAKQALLDVLGCTVAASFVMPPAIERGLMALAGPGSSRAVGRDARYMPHYAALFNAIAAHSLDFDDTHADSAMHPGAAVIPAIVAMGEEVAAGGLRILTAIVLAYDVSVRLSQALTPRAQSARGFHATAVCSTFGAAAALGYLAGDDAARIESALGLAGAVAMGNLQFLVGGDANKRIQVAYAAHNAIVAHRLAAAGVPGSPRALEGKFGAFVNYSGSPAVTALEALATDRRAIEETAIKPYPCNRFAHAALDALLELLAESDLAPGEIDHIEVRIPTATGPLIAHPRDRKCRPQSIVDAQFSVYFVVAATALRRRFTMAEYDLLGSADIERMIERIDVTTDVELDQGSPSLAGAIVLRGRARTWTRRVDVPGGEPKRPLDWPALVAKFDALASPGYGARRRAEIVACVRHLDQLGDIRDLTALLGAAT